MVVVEVLPFLEPVVEQLSVVDDDAFELAVELLGVDPVGALGRAYWYAVYPLHQLVFRDMLRGIARAALREVQAPRGPGR